MKLGNQNDSSKDQNSRANKKEKGGGSLSQVLDEKQRQLVATHVRLAGYLVTRYLKRHGLYPGMNREDLESAAIDGLIVAATYYRPGKAMFGSYAWSMIWRKMNGAVREQKRRWAARRLRAGKGGVRIRPDTAVDKKAGRPLDLAEVNEGVEAVWQEATHAERHFLRLHFWDGVDQTTAGKRAFGLSRGATSERWAKTRRRWQEELACV